MLLRAPGMPLAVARLLAMEEVLSRGGLRREVRAGEDVEGAGEPVRVRFGDALAVLVAVGGLEECEAGSLSFGEGGAFISAARRR